MFENNNEYLISGILNKYVGDATVVVIPEGITEIADSAFENGKVTEVVFSSTVEKVGDNAFKNCASLKKVAFTGSIKRFGYDAFAECTSLEKVEFDGDIGDWLNISFAGYTSNPLYYGALFVKGEKLNELIIDADEVGAYAFCGLDVDKLVFRRPLKRIGSGAFSDCKYKGALDVDVEEIGELAFRGTAFPEIRLGKTLKSVDSWAFFRCSAAKVFYEGNLKEWLSVFIRDVWANPAYDAELYVGGEKLIDISIPDGVETVGDAAFAGVKIKSVTFNDGVKRIGEAAFYGCEELERVYGISPTTYVHPDAFALCANLNK